ncbi:hypothetical protein C7M84_015123 [Penaeus vannamei]|uniref:Fibrinogen C-terminal domain-containing protein n=1 Tax=Penaeus vannamei TaxID=6689 RepID=A0A3R7SM88_PENVA|nr:hypothetical protein C7M84_015123 [Penaeus vannamei]
MHELPGRPARRPQRQRHLHHLPRALLPRQRLLRDGRRRRRLDRVPAARRRPSPGGLLRTWMEYARGFGSSPCREFWLGLDHIHALTSHAPAELRVDLADFEGATAYAKYSSFHVADRASDYKLTVGGYSGTAGDSMIPRQNGYGFSAKDKGLACANKYFGGWWYGSPCHFSNLNGLYLSGPHDTFAVGVNWYHWKGFGYSLKTTVMMTRPVT